MNKKIRTKIGNRFKALRGVASNHGEAAALRSLPPVINRWLIAIEKCLANVAGCIILGMMSLTVIEITLRKLSGRSIEGVFEGVELMIVAIVYLGLAHVQSLEEHVRVELLITRVPFKARQILEALNILLALAFFSLATWMTGKQAWESWLIRETTFLPAALPVWLARGLVTIGFFFLWMRLIIQLGERIYNLLISQEKSARIQR